MIKKVFTLIILVAIMINNVHIIMAEEFIKLKFDGKCTNYDERPIILDGIPFIPMEMIIDKFKVTIDKGDGGVIYKGTRDADKITFKLGSRYVYLNNKKITLEKYPIKINKSVMLPIDFVEKVFEVHVSWDEENRLLNIYSDNKLRVHFIDVGEGDCILIDYKDYDIIIDCGGDYKGEIIKNYLKNLNIQDIDIFVATHNDLEHIGSMEEIFQTYNVKNVVYSGSETAKKSIDISTRYLLDGSFTNVMSDEMVEFELGNGVWFKVIETGDDYKNINNNSVITMLEHNDVRFLFTGDMETKVEIENLDKFFDIDILKVANHGMNTSTSESFLGVVKPEVAVISSGVYEVTQGVNEELDGISNSEEVINRLEERNIATYNTKDVGNIIITTDGKSYQIETVKVNGVYIRQLDFVNQTITVYNDSHISHDLSNYIVTDISGENVYYIKSGSIVESKYQRIFSLVKSKKEQGEDDGLNNNQVILRKDFISDRGILYDEKFNILFQYR